MLLVTLGDPFSINVEILLTALARTKAAESMPVVIIGSESQLNFQAAALAQEPPEFQAIAAGTTPSQAGLYFCEVGDDSMSDNPKAWPSEKRGMLALAALQALSKWSVGKFSVITAPVNKMALHHAGYQFAGQTEYFADLWQGDSLMLLAGPKLRVGLVTTHIPLSEVAKNITADLVLRKLAALARSMPKLFGKVKPKIAVLGLNPHAGEAGLLGHEDEKVIALACREFNKIMGKKIAFGPLPADTAFYAAMQGRYDAVLAMYHDQGLAPLKTVHFAEAINITAGLKHLRVSPDHGTATDLFLQQKASAESMVQAIAFAMNYQREVP